MASKKYDLEKRTFLFAKSCRFLVRDLPKTVITIEDCKQLVRASGSIGANYIEANESLSKKDFIYRIKICRKEAKESQYWLRLLKGLNSEEKISVLIQEADELKRIFSSIVEKTK